MRKISLLIISVLFSVFTYGQLSGIKNIPGDYATIALAVADLNAQGVAAPGVVFNVLAGNPETAPAGGYVIGGVGSLVLTTAINLNTQIGFQGNGNIITANNAHAVGALNDAIFKLIGADYVTINGFTLQENPANIVTAAATNTMTEWGVALLYVTTTDGCQNNTISSCSIDLDRTYQNTFGIYSNSTHSATTVSTSATATGLAGGNSNLKITGNIITDVNIGIVIIGPTAAADHNDILTIGGSLANANTITNYGTTGTFSSYANVSGTVNGILVRNTKNYSISYNTVTSSIGGVTTGTLNGIQIPAYSNAPTGAFTNSISYNSISLKSGSAAGAMNGITCPSGSASTTSIINITNNDFNNFGHTVAGTGSITFIIQTSAHFTENINNNTFTNITVNTTGSVTFISSSITVPAGGTQNINSNAIVTAFSKTGAGGTVTGITSSGSSTTVTSNWNNNIFSNITLTGATTLTLFNQTDGGSVNHNIIGNTINNIIGGTNTLIGIYSSFGGGNGGNGNYINNNTISNITGGGAITAIGIGASGTSTTVFSNTIFAVASTGAFATVGITSAAPTSCSIYKNKIYDISNSNAGGSVIGIAVTGGTLHNVYNNILGDLRTTNANAANPLIGLNISGGTTVNAYYNTINLNGTSSGVLFGSTGINASTTPTIDLRNNIIVNTSTPAGATGFAIAYRRSTTTLTTYAATSNNNLFFAGTPTANNLIYYDGTNSDQTLAAFKIRMATRDAVSVTENPTWVSTVGANADFLHINTTIPTYIESNGANIVTYTNDFDADIRQGNGGYTGTGTAPDIGADEFEGVKIPICAGTPVAGTATSIPAIVTCSGTSSINITGQTSDLGITYQWQSSPDNITYSDIVGATASSYATPIISTTTYYHCVVTCTNSGLSATTNNVTVTVNPVAGGTTISTLTTVCSGANFTLSLTGNSNAGVTYQWQSSADGITYADILGATAATFLTSQIVATYYQCIITCTASASTATSTPIQILLDVFTNCYCASNATSVVDEDIFNVTFGSLNNTSTCATTGGPGSILNQYSNFTAVAAPNVAQTTTVPFSVQIGTCGGNYGNGCAIWIDYNQNGSFADAGEKVYFSAGLTTGPHVETGNIIIPISAVPGLTKMRVVDSETAVPSNPCATYSWGETEDYLVNIVALPATPPTPTQSVAVPTCISGTDLTVTGTPPIGEVWYWQTTAAGTSTTQPVSGAYNVLVNGTYYVRAFNTTYNVWSANSSSYTVSNIPVAPLPPTPSATTPACLSTSITVPAASGTVTYYWQGTTSGGTSTANNASTPYTATTSDTYYVAAFDAATSCWSNTSGLAVIIDNYVPAVPTTTSNSISICQGAVSAQINAAAAGSGSLISSFGTNLQSPGTPVTFNITVPSLPAGATITGTQLVVMSATAINGSYRSEIRVALSGATTLAATQISTLGSAGLITPDPSITVPNLPLAGGAVTLTLTETYDDGGAGTIDATFAEIELVINYTLPSSTINWWNAATIGTLTGTGSPFETVGSTVLPNTSIAGTYMFYAEAASGSCVSTSRLPVSVVVNPVLVALTPTDVSCNGGSNGSFALGTVTCGVAPFTYSVDAGSYGSIPTNLTAGTHTVIVKDFNGDLSSSVNVVISEPSWTVPVATGSPVSACTNATTAVVSVTPGSVAIPQTVILPFNVIAQPVEINAAPGNIVASATLASIPAGATITSAVLNYNGITALGSSWQADVRLGFAGAVVDPAAAGAGATNTSGLFNYTRNIPPAAFNLAGGNVDLLYWDAYSDNVGDESTFPLGASVATLTITYNPGSAIAWYDAASGGTLLGTSATLETVGTSVLPNTTTSGMYNFYAEGNYSGCTSSSRTLITVTVNPLPTIALTSSSAVTICNGGNTDIILALTGTAPWTWVGNDGSGPATFNATSSPVTSNVTPTTNTTYSIISVTDANGCINTSTESVVVTVDQAPVAGTATATDLAVCTGNGTSVNLASSTGNIQWQSSADGLTWADISGETTATLNTGNLTSNTYYQAVVSNGVCAPVTSNNQMVTVNPSPTPTITGTLTMCSGSSTALDAGAAYTTYLWSTGAVTQTVTVTTAGSYFVVVSDSNGCSGTDTVSITINTSTPVIITENTGVLTSDATSGNQWYEQTLGIIAGETNQTYTPTVDGNYYVILTDGNGCTSLSNVISFVLSTSNIALNSGLNIYPNPASGKVFVEVSNSINSAMTIELMTMDGRVLFVNSSEVSGKLTINIDINNYASGIYMIKAVSENKTIIQKLIIQ